MFYCQIHADDNKLNTKLWHINSVCIFYLPLTVYCSQGQGRICDLIKQNESHFGNEFYVVVKRIHVHRASEIENFMSIQVTTFCNKHLKLFMTKNKMLQEFHTIYNWMYSTRWLKKWYGAMKLTIL